MSSHCFTDFKNIRIKKSYHGATNVERKLRGTFPLSFEVSKLSGNVLLLTIRRNLCEFHNKNWVCQNTEQQIKQSGRYRKHLEALLKLIH